MATFHIRNDNHINGKDKHQISHMENRESRPDLKLKRNKYWQIYNEID